MTRQEAIRWVLYACEEQEKKLKHGPGREPGSYARLAKEILMAFDVQPEEIEEVEALDRGN